MRRLQETQQRTSGRWWRLGARLLLGSEAGVLHTRWPDETKASTYRGVRLGGGGAEQPTRLAGVTVTARVQDFRGQETKTHACDVIACALETGF